MDLSATHNKRIMKRLAITGSSGYLGGKLVEYFRGQGVTVLGIDVQQPGDSVPDEFLEADVRDTSWSGALASFEPDTVIHSAFVFQPIRDLKRMRQINVGGTQNVLEMVRQVAPARFMLVSSATAFGAWPDNPVPLAEDWPLRPRHEFQYAADKTEVELLIAAFAKQHTEICVSWVRPSIVGGPRMDNYLERFIFGMPFLARLDGFDTPLQFVHEDDVVLAIDSILAADGRGAYNLGPPDWTCVSEVARETNRRALWIPFWLARFSAWLAWSVRLWIHETPAGFLYFARYPWVVAPQRLADEIGYQFRYTSTETLREIIRHRK
jgi:UDP-glucose 4-epimerase